MNGGCLCGNIRFSATGDPDFPDLCSCEHCQRLSGAPVMSWVSFPEEDFAWTGPGGESFARRGTSAHSRRRYPIWRSVVTAILSSGACSRKTRCVSMRPPQGRLHTVSVQRPIEAITRHALCHLLTTIRPSAAEESDTRACLRGTCAHHRS
ncbi:GFA family protein [Nocardia fluminea]